MGPHERHRPSAPLVVVIDGPAGAGKTTVARAVARALGLPLLDTGAIYRTLALVAQRRAIAWDDEPGLAALAVAFPIALGELPADGGPQAVRYAGEDVTAAIRTPAMSQGASKVSALPAVRAALLGIQRALGDRGCVAEGRDMGTVVFPDAPHKFFLTADLPTRALRRHAELAANPGAAVPSLDEVQREVAERDARDSSRAAAPLRQADDAVLVDSSGVGIDAVVERVLEHIRAATGA
ncbi:MAG: (d)CMP kinase [Nannocystaceae bacterium]|nr:(d)CMP kinase [Nannocystaceae bacterium]